ncbi:MAG: phosphate ABC transporter permease subunit PstC [Bacteroidia bacterium]|nr:phosphate ABC transporter permease subunit PstC [Bacteroidia bacterium]
MARPRTNWRERAMEALIRTCGYASSVIVLLIVFFLFKEGLGLFAEEPIEEGYALGVAPSNPVERLSAAEVRAIHERSITNWREVGGEDLPIFLLNVDNLESLVTEAQLGPDYVNLPSLIARYTSEKPGILLAFPKSYFPPSVKVLTLPNLGVGNFLSGKAWYPTATPSPEFGAWPLIAGTFLVTLGAILFALPLGLAVAIYLAELANDRLRGILKPMVELLAGIPSVVYGFFGLVVIVPQIKALFNLDVGETALAGSLMLAIIALPTIITVSEDAIRSVPQILRDASLGLGATHWQTITKVVVPYAISGISAATILGVGRAVGETMTVLMVTGNAADPNVGFLKPVRTLSATIAAELGEAPQGGLHYKALFMVGCVLFVITFGFNLLAETIAHRQKKALEG